MARSTSFFQKALHSRILFIIGCVLLLMLALALVRQQWSNREIEGQIAALQNQQSQLTAKQNQLTSLQAALQTQTYLEREARLELNLEKPGEHLAVIQTGDGDDSAAAVDNAVPTLAAAPDVSNPVRWWDFFFNRPAFNALVDSSS